MMRYLPGIDVGGTFTDFVSYEKVTQKFVVWKRLTTQADPVEGILEGIKALDKLRDVEKDRLGKTVVTNALLQRTGAVVAYLTTEGFRDVPFMQRGHRKSHYDPSWIKANPFVKRRHCYEVSERIDYQGSVVVQLDETKLRDLARSMHSGGEIGAIAVCFLHSYPHPSTNTGRAIFWLRNSLEFLYQSRLRSCRNGKNTSALQRRSPTPL
jgi:N-methylhydantoinase A